MFNFFKPKKPRMAREHAAAMPPLYFRRGGIPILLQVHGVSISRRHASTGAGVELS
jgi:hypothetical protein